MIETENVLSYGQYLLFLYLCMADADKNISLTEVDVLFDKMDVDLFDSSGPHELMISIVYKKYKKLNAEQRLDLIRKYAPEYLKTQQFALQVISNLNSIIQADGEEKASETLMLQSIKKITNELK